MFLFMLVRTYLLCSVFKHLSFMSYSLLYKLTIQLVHFFLFYNNYQIIKKFILLCYI